MKQIIMNTETDAAFLVILDPEPANGVADFEVLFLESATKMIHATVGDNAIFPT